MPLKIHHLNCATYCPYGGHLFDGRTRGLGPATLVCHCLLIETDAGLVLVDTALGLRDDERPVPRLSPLYLKMLRPRLDPEETAARQIERLGFARRDVRHIVLTHLDFDHAGGLQDFPEAEIHVFGAELDAARRRDGFVARRRYRPMQWDGAIRWHTYAPGGEPWFGFPAVRGLQGLPPEILMIPLAGHTPGHCGVAVERAGGWLLHAGDAYFFRGEMGPDKPTCTPGLRSYQRLMEADRPARLANQARLRELVRQNERASGDGRPSVRVFSAHDAVEFETLAGTPDAVAAATPGLRRAV